MSFTHRRNVLLPAILLASLCFSVGSSLAQSPASDSAPRLTWLRDPNVKEEYKKWLREDVVYIISDEERADFKKMVSDRQRDDFVVAFWERKNPTPGSARNAYKEEHYRRLAYANSNFAAGVPGWRTDRGHFYITFGPPDSVDAKPAFAPPTETWHYFFIEGIGRNVVLTFTDKCLCGKYELTGGDSDLGVPKIYEPLRY
jgi:GWxTD domain-containing protein